MERTLKETLTFSIRRKFPSDPFTACLITGNVILSLLIVHVTIDIIQTINTESPVEEAKPLSSSCKCKDMLELSRGTWVRGQAHERLRSLQHSNLTDQDIRRRLFLPDKLYRNDLRCGLDNPLVNFTLPATCDPNGNNYCCNEKFGWCGNTSDHCTQGTSVDFRRLVPEEEAVWKPASDHCELIEFSRKDACNLMAENQINLIFMGDSEARKFLTAFLLFLTGDFERGLLHSGIDKAQWKACHGELQLLNDDCHTVVHDSSISLEDPDMCGYSTSFLVEYYPDFDTFLTSRTSERIKTLFNSKNTYIILNGGSHFNANSQAFLNYYLRFVVELLQTKKWPKLIVETLPKTPSVILSNQRERFGNAVAEFCSKHNIPVFNNFQLGSNLQTYDGKHFRLPYYLQKVQILLGYLRKEIELC